MHANTGGSRGGGGVIGSGFISNCLPVMGAFKHFSGLSIKFSITFSVSFDHSQMFSIGAIEQKSQLGSSQAPPLPVTKEQIGTKNKASKDIFTECHESHNFES